MGIATDRQPTTLADPRSNLGTRPADDASTVRQPVAVRVLQALHDPELLPCLAFLLLPAALMTLRGDTIRASFFAGAACYLACLKWLGWVCVTRPLRWTGGFLLFPLEVFLGLALCTFWFYLRSLLADFWPGSFSVRELHLLPWLVAFVHLLPVNGSRFSFRNLERGTKRRLLLYVPYVVFLTLALWHASSWLEVQSIDCLTHAVTTRLYHAGGLAAPIQGGTRELCYPSGFAALNVVAVAVAPLSVPQAVNLQHVLLLVTALFLVGATVVRLAGESSHGWLLGLTLPYLAVLPVYYLHPDTGYGGTGRQCVAALVTVMILLPFQGPLTAPWHASLLAGLLGILTGLTATLNPGGAPFAALACLLAVIVLVLRTPSRMGACPRWRALGLACALVLLTAVPVVLTDRYYASLLFRSSTVLTVEEAPQRLNMPLFAWQEGLTALGGIDPFGFDAAWSTIPANVAASSNFNSDWPRSPLPRALSWLAVGGGLVAGTWWLRWRVRTAPGEERALAALLLGLLVIWFVGKYAGALAVHGLQPRFWYSKQLAVYLGFCLIRWQVFLVYGLLLTWPTLVAMGCWSWPVQNARLQRRRVRRLSICAVALCCSSLGLISSQCGPWIIPPFTHGGPVTQDDLRLVAWMDANLPPERGVVGLAAHVYRFGVDSAGNFVTSNQAYEKHVLPLAGAQAPMLYGQAWNYRFSNVDVSQASVSYDDYVEHVRHQFDAAWCLRNNVRYFYVPDNSLKSNPGLQAAIRRQHLRPVQRIGSSCIYEVLPPAAAPLGEDVH